MTRRRQITPAAFLLACAVAAPLAAHAQAPAAPAPASAASQPAGKAPNLSGTWELNVAASNFGMQGGGPSKGTMTVVQAGDKITRTQMMASDQGNMTNTMHHTIGVATTDTVSAAGQSLPFTSTARWEGATLVVDGKVAVQGMEIPVVSRYSLSPDGKKLMVDQVVTTPMGEQPTHLVYDKKS